MTDTIDPADRTADDTNTQPTTGRGRAKAVRRDALLAAAASLFADRGYRGVTMEDLGAAAGVSGPAVYRHFSGKQAVIGALLVGVSRSLLTGGSAVVGEATEPRDALANLVRFHVEFALSNPDVIRAQDQDLGSLSEQDRKSVRSLQRAYVELWVETIGRLHAEDAADSRVRAHAVFGLINSTPHSARRHGAAPARATVRVLLEEMALRALLPQ
jgi:AcrR family transcriptional regulator